MSSESLIVCTVALRRKQLLPVQNLQHAVVADAPCRVDAVSDDVVGHCPTAKLAGRIRMFVRGSEVATGPVEPGCPPTKPKVRI